MYKREIKMGADDFLLESYNMFYNPGLLQIQNVNGYNELNGNYLHENINSIYYSNGTPIGSFSPYSGESAFSYEGFINNSGTNNFYNPGVTLFNQSAVHDYKSSTSYSAGNIFNYTGGTGYANSYKRSESLLNYSGVYGNKVHENMVTGGIFTAEEISESSKGYRFGITGNGSVKYYDPKGKEVTAEEFKTAVGDDFGKFKTAINKECEKRGHDKAIS